jgi:hypothetical protein
MDGHGFEFPEPSSFRGDSRDVSPANPRRESRGKPQRDASPEPSVREDGPLRLRDVGSAMQLGVCASGERKIEPWTKIRFPGTRRGIARQRNRSSGALESTVPFVLLRCKRTQGARSEWRCAARAARILSLKSIAHGAVPSRCGRGGPARLARPVDFTVRSLLSSRPELQLVIARGSGPAHDAGRHRVDRSSHEAHVGR